MSVMSSTQVIEALTEANCVGYRIQDRIIFAEALHALVRLAKAEQLLQMRKDVAASVGTPP